MRLHHWVFLVALVFVIMACVNSLRLTRRHLVTSGPRDVRAFTVRILLMVPVYSIESWLALVLRASEFNKVLALLRKGYECLVLLSFKGILLAWLGGPEILASSLEPGCCRHIGPLAYVLPNWTPASLFVRRTLTGVLQNVFCSVVVVTVILCSWCLGRLSPRAYDVVQHICLVVMNVSQFFAVYCIVTFYHANRWQLAPLRPVQKLLSIKGLVFCLFWQEAAIRVAEKAGVFDRWLGTSEADTWDTQAPDAWTVPQVAWGLLNCIICVEMFFLSLLHCRVYPPGETVRLRKLLLESVEEALDLQDMVCDSLALQADNSSGWLPEQSCSNLEEHDMCSLHESGDSLAERNLVHTRNAMSPTAVARHVVEMEAVTSDADSSAQHVGASRTSSLPVSPSASAKAHSYRVLPQLSQEPLQLSCSPDSIVDPSLSGSEPGWEALRRFLAALDLSDVLRFYRSLREPWEPITAAAPNASACRRAASGCQLDTPERGGVAKRSRVSVAPAGVHPRMYYV